MHHRSLPGLWFAFQIFLLGFADGFKFGHQIYFLKMVSYFGVNAVFSSGSLVVSVFDI